MDTTETAAVRTVTARSPEPGVLPDRPSNWSPIPDVVAGERSWVLSLWRRICHEPTLMFSTAYLLVAFLGLWSSWWFYQGFGIAILDYLQASDFLVAGLRDPAYVLLFVCGVLLAVLVTWPDTLRRRHPHYIEALRGRHWWARMVFARSRLMSWDGVGIHPVTGVSLVVVSSMLLGSAIYMQGKGELLREGKRGAPVRVHLIGEAAPQAGQARLLGTSSAFVYLWWPAQRRAEAVPITSVRQLQAMPLKPRAAVKAAPATGLPVQSSPATR